MANPNIVNVATINGESQGLALGTGDANVIIAAIVADKVVKAAYTSAATGAAGNVGTIYLAKTISIPADASLVLLDTPIYMQTGDALQGGASAASDLEVFVSYDVIA